MNTVREFMTSSTCSDGRRVEEEHQVLGLDLLELQHVGDADDRGEAEAGVGAEQRRHMRPEQRMFEHGRPRLDAGRLHRRQHLQHHDDRQDEHAEAALVGGDLGVEVGEPSSQTNVEIACVVPANGTWPASIVCMPIDEGVDERPGDQQRRRGTSGGRCTPREMNRVGDKRESAYR